MGGYKQFTPLLEGNTRSASIKTGSSSVCCPFILGSLFLGYLVPGSLVSSSHIPGSVLDLGSSSVLSLILSSHPLILSSILGLGMFILDLFSLFVLGPLSISTLDSLIFPQAGGSVLDTLQYRMGLLAEIQDSSWPNGRRVRSKCRMVLFSLQCVAGGAC